MCPMGEDSPPRRGGVAARSIRSREATLFRADGVVSSAPLRHSAGLTTPSAPLLEAARCRACASRKGGFAIFLLMSRPPLLCKEGNMPACNSFTCLGPILRTCDNHRFRFHVIVQRFFAVLFAEAALLHAAEWKLVEDDLWRIDPGITSLQTLGGGRRPIQIACPDR